jgi:hypothetical protein
MGAGSGRDRAGGALLHGAGVIHAGDGGPRAPSAVELLEVWERGQGAESPERSILLLSLVEPGSTSDAVGQLTVGQQNARLLRLRELAFGDRLDGLTDCPSCGDTLEVSVHSPGLRRAGADGVSVPHEGSSTAPRELEVEAGGHRVRFRPPTLADVHAILDVEDDAPAALLERCLTDLEGISLPLPPELAKELAAQMSSADPLADPELAMKCPSCSHRWTAPLDVPSYLWEEIDVWARRTLDQVHRLASAYGWGEAEILALSPARRRAYLDLVER